MYLVGRHLQLASPFVTKKTDISFGVAAALALVLRRLQFESSSSTWMLIPTCVGETSRHMFSKRLRNILGAIAKLQKAAISFVVSLCLSAHIETYAHNGRIFMKFHI